MKTYKELKATSFKLTEYELEIIEYIESWIYTTDSNYVLLSLDMFTKPFNSSRILKEFREAGYKAEIESPSRYYRILWEK